VSRKALSQEQWRFVRLISLAPSLQRGDPLADKNRKPFESAESGRRQMNRYARLALDEGEGDTLDRIELSKIA
jgi:hypothetical protein